MAAFLCLVVPVAAHAGFYRRTHTYLDKDQVLAYDPAAGGYSVLQMIRGAALRRGSCQTFNPVPLRRGMLPTFRKHTYLGDERLLEVDPQNGDFRVLCFNRTLPCHDLDVAEAPKAFGQVVQKGRLLAFVDADLITSLGQDEILIQNRAAASYSIRMYDRNADLPPPQAFVEAQRFRVLAPGETEFGQPFPGESVASGVFDRPPPLSLMYAGKGLLLGYAAGGPHWSLWSYDRTATGGDSTALQLSRTGVWSRNVSRSESSAPRELTYLGSDLVLDYEPGSCGYTVPRLTPEAGPEPATFPSLPPGWPSACVPPPRRTPYPPTNRPTLPTMAGLAVVAHVVVTRQSTCHRPSLPERTSRRRGLLLHAFLLGKMRERR